MGVWFRLLFYQWRCNSVFWATATHRSGISYFPYWKHCIKILVNFTFRPCSLKHIKNLALQREIKKKLFLLSLCKSVQSCCFHRGVTCGTIKKWRCCHTLKLDETEKQGSELGSCLPYLSWSVVGAGHGLGLGFFFFPRVLETVSNKDCDVCLCKKLELLI